MKLHRYTIQNQWTGNQGKGTESYNSYSRDHQISSELKAGRIPCSSDPQFRGDPSRYNPEELLVASLSGCHMLWYLHLCAVNEVMVLEYKDEAIGEMEELENGSGRFKQVILRPVIRIANEDMLDKAQQLHHQANRMCFIANSCNFPVLHQPEFTWIK